MFLGDTLLIGLSYMVTVSLARGKEFGLGSIYHDIGIILLLLILTVLLLHVHGLYQVRHKRRTEIILSVISVSIWDIVFVGVLTFFLVATAYPARELAIDIFFQGLSLTGWRYLFWLAERQRQKNRLVLLIGSADECNHVWQRLSKEPELNMRLKYVCTDMENTPWQDAAQKVDIILICPNMRHRHKVELINYCHAHGKRPLLIPNTYEIFVNTAELSRIDDIPVFRPHTLRPSLETRVLKRAMDIVLATIGLIGALPFMLFTAIAIKLTDPGPLIYSQIRTGKDGKEFKVHKFRTMKVDAEKTTGPMLAQEDDPRITKTGRFLRQVRLDELLQIFNVLRGHMSIVGPRPERPFFVKKFTNEIPEYAYRHNVKPGITGLAQVYGKYNTTAFDKLTYDLMYIQKMSLWLDIVIIIRTVKVLLTKSATEGTKSSTGEVNLERYAIGRAVYGDF